MRYKGIYWTFFSPMIKRSITNRFDKELAAQSIRNGKAGYRRLLSRADDLGPGNPMVMNAYFAYVFAAAWLGSDRKITPDEMALLMKRVEELMDASEIFYSLAADTVYIEQEDFYETLYEL